MHATPALTQPGCVKSLHSLLFCSRMLNNPQAALEAGGRISKSQALALVSTNLEKLLGGKSYVDGTADLVATDGAGLFDLESRVVAVLSPIRGTVDLL